jgi:hypothetical protein
LVSQQAGLDLGKLYTPEGFIGKDEAKKVMRGLLSEDKGWAPVEGRPDRYVFTHPNEGYTLTVGVGKDGIGIHGIANEDTKHFGGGDWLHVFTDEHNQPQVVNALKTIIERNLEGIKQNPVVQIAQEMGQTFNVINLLQKKEQAEAMLGIKLPGNLFNLNNPNSPAATVDHAVSEHLGYIINESKKDLN